MFSFMSCIAAASVSVKLLNAVQPSAVCWNPEDLENIKSVCKQQDEEKLKCYNFHEEA